MSEWWTYSLSDFLMFSLRTYFRQFELLNRDVWPLHIVALAVGVIIVGCMLHIRPVGMKITFALLDVAWVWVAWAYHIGRYADINTGAPWFAAGFCIQAVLMLWLALRPQARPHAAGAAPRLALLMLAVALVAYPLLALLNKRSPWQAEVFAIAPDPTVALTLGVLLFWRAPWFAWIIPIVWSAASGATLMALHAPQAWLLPSMSAIALAAGMAQARGPLRN